MKLLLEDEEAKVLLEFISTARKQMNDAPVIDELIRRLGKAVISANELTEVINERLKRRASKTI